MHHPQSVTLEHPPATPETGGTVHVEAIGSLALGDVTPEGAAHFAAWEVELATQAPGEATASSSENEALADILLPEAKPTPEPGKFPEADEPYGPRTISEGRYAERLNWRLDYAGSAVDRAARHITSEGDAQQLNSLRAGALNARQNGDPYSKIDQVIAVEKEAFGLAHRVGAG